MIAVDQLSKSFASRPSETVHAVKEVSFEVSPGRVFAILGPNGSGKTTLLRMLSGLMAPDSGTITIDEMHFPQQAEKIKAKIGFLTGSAALHKKLTPAETLDLFASLYGMKKEMYHRRREELVDILGISELMGRLVGTLSMGQKQKVMIARALLHDPSIVIFDEATAGLDVMAAKVMMDAIKKCREEGKTVLFSTHIMGEVALLAQDVLILHRGSVVYNDTFEALLEQQRSASLEEEFIRILEGGGA